MLRISTEGDVYILGSREDDTTTDDSNETHKENNRAMFYEDGATLEVQVLEDLCTRTIESFRLKVIRTLRAHPLGYHLESGHEFTCYQSRGADLWKLKLEGE